MARKFEVVSKYQTDTEVNKKLMTEFIKPKRSTKQSACYDIFNNTGEDIVINPGETSDKVTTYLKIKMDPTNVCMIYVRSSHGFKYTLNLANNTAVIDADYYDNVNNEGECFIKFHNHGTVPVIIPAKTAMAQAMFIDYLLTEDDDDTVGGLRVGGIGSTTK